MNTVSKLLVVSALFLSITFPVHAQIEGDVIALGDSLTAGEARDSSGLITCASLGGAVIPVDRQRICIGGGQANIGGWPPELSRALGVDVFNFGNTGELSTEILNRLSSHLASTPSQFVLILAGTNDVLFGMVSQARTIANLKAMIRLARDAGREPIIGTLPPLLFSVLASRNPNILSINNEIRAFDDVQVADLYSVLVDDWAENTSGDFIHLGVRGNSVVAKEWFRAIKASQRSFVIAPIIDLLLSD